MKLEGSLEQKGMGSTGQVSAAATKTTSPGLASIEKTLDLNEDLKLTGKRVVQETSETKAGRDKATGRWTKAEHARFLEGKFNYLQIALKLYGKHWKLVEKHIGTRSGTQVRSHAQKYYMKIGAQKVKEEEVNRSVVPVSEEDQQRISDFESKEEVSIEEKKADDKISEPIPEQNETILNKGNSCMGEDIRLPSKTAEALNNILLDLKDNENTEEKQKYERLLLELRHSTNLFMHRVGKTTNSNPKAIEALEEECKTTLDALSNTIEHILLRIL